MCVCEELNERYDGDAASLYAALRSVRKPVLISAVKQMLENGCFCPSCCLTYVEMIE